ncbi:hypothetical protein [Sporosarcina ureilytica]|uniref:Spore coat protein n=1 Tax=Sporosarcina ureilytica TaxID=298596 RepID=A0A1D8JCQ3_9BACL|nr:hypothetical protein [Sporosarcina ureilytica]AOV06485.1 hypothetical protein BI350_01925 [Sporosarcina ureilytica]
MMNHGNMHHGNMHHENMHHGNMPEHMGHHQVQPIVCPPVYRCHDQFSQREVPVIHPVVNVNRHHVVDVPRHYYTETTQDVMGASFSPGENGPGFGPGFGPGMGLGPAFEGGRGHGHGHGCGCGCGGARRCLWM